MNDLIGKDLAGWELQVWYELLLVTGNEGESKESGGFFSDRVLALAVGQDKGPWKNGGTTREVMVLTEDGYSGFVVGADSVQLEDEAALRVVAVEKAKSQLTEADRALLKLDK